MAPTAPDTVAITMGATTRAAAPGSSLLIGRGTQCHLMTTDLRVSRIHATVRCDAGGTWIMETSGANGSFESGQRVADRTPLRAGMRLRLGDAVDGPLIIIDLQPAFAATEVVVITEEVSAAGTRQLHQPEQSDASATDQSASGDVSGVPVRLRPGHPVRIGRSLDNDVVVTSLLASRCHAQVDLTPHGPVLEDLGSGNGTQLDGANVHRAELSEGDVFSIGAHRFTVRGGVLMAERSTTSQQVLIAENISFDLPDHKRLLDGVSFAAPPHALVAVIGPSGAGKSTLLSILTGARDSSHGRVLFDERDMRRDRDEMRHRVGLVPQDDVVHRMLTVRTALDYAAQLRFPDDLDKAARDQRVTEVIAELGLEQHADTRIDRLSGGQRKRSSVALELLTRPSLLFLDEPTSGLDPGLDKQVMATLRGLADDDRTVVVVTHSVDNLDICDRVLLLGPGGKVAYFGPPAGLLAHFEHTLNHPGVRFSDVFEAVASDPDEHQSRFAATEQGRQLRSAVQCHSPAAGTGSGRGVSQPSPSRRGQLWTLLRRQVSIILADRSYAVSMVALPVILAIFTWLVPGGHGFSAPPPGPPSAEAKQTLVLLIIGASFMGMAATIRDLIGERAIFQRESSVGLSPSVYLGGKLIVYAALVTCQSIVLVLLCLLLKDGPAAGSVIGSAAVELIVACALCAFASAALGLWFSSLVSSPDQVMPILVVSVMAQLVLSGGLFAVVGRPGLEQIAWLAPAHWGFAAAASTVNINAISPPTGDVDHLWDHDAGRWLLCVAVLLLQSAIFSVLTLHRLQKTRI